MHESATQAPDKLRPAAGGKGATRVSLADTDSSFECGPRETFLRAALKAGLAVPYECASGSCGSCKARLLEGAVEMRWQGATGLSERDRKRGDRILCCQSIPTTDCVIQWGVIREIANRPRMRLSRRFARSRIFALACVD